MVGYFDMDPEDNIPVGLDQRLRQAFGHKGVGTSNYWGIASWTMPTKKGKFYVDDGEEERLVLMGRFNMLVMTQSNATADTGVFWIHYKCRLSRSKIDTATVNKATFYGAAAYSDGAGLIDNSHPFGLNPGVTSNLDVFPSAGLGISWRNETDLSSSVNRMYLPIGYSGAFVMYLYNKCTSDATVTNTWSFGGSNVSFVTDPVMSYYIFNSGFLVSDTGAAPAVKGTDMFNVLQTNTPCAIDPITGAPNTYVDIGTNETYTQDQLVYNMIYVVPIEISPVSLNTKRLWARASKLTNELIALKQQVRMLETDEQKEKIADGVATTAEDVKRMEKERDALDREPLERKDHRHRSLGPAIKSAEDEADDRKRAIEHLVGIGLGNELNVLPRAQNLVRPADQVVDPRGGWISRLSDDGFVNIQRDQELSDFKERTSDRPQAVGVPRGADRTERTADAERRSEAGKGSSEVTPRVSSRK
jgi:hypothetical protein